MQVDVEFFLLAHGRLIPHFTTIRHVVMTHKIRVSGGSVNSLWML